MEFNTLVYLCKMGFKNMSRNRVYLGASVMTMSICIFLFGICFLAMSNGERMLKSVEDGMAVLVFFDEDITQKQIEEIGTKIRQRPEVTQTKYISGAQAWDTFQSKVFEEPLSLSEAEGQQNPLANSDNYQVQIRGIQYQKDFVSYVKTLEGVRKVTHSEAAAEVLTRLNKVIRAISMLSMGILALISILLINNTLAVSMEARKEKIKLMLLMGAQNAFVKVPYIMEGLVIGILGAGIPLLILLPTYWWGADQITAQLQLVQRGIQLLPVGAVFPQLSILAVLLSVGAGFISSLLTIHHHLKR